MKCIACDKEIEEVNLDEALELCNKCYGEYLKASRDTNDLLPRQLLQDVLGNDYNEENF